VVGAGARPGSRASRGLPEKQIYGEEAWAQSFAAADATTQDILRRGAQQLFWGQSLPRRVVYGHLARSVGQELGEALRWDGEISKAEAAKATHTPAGPDSEKPTRREPEDSKDQASHESGA